MKLKVLLQLFLMLMTLSSYSVELRCRALVLKEGIKQEVIRKSQSMKSDSISVINPSEVIELDIEYTEMDSSWLAVWYSEGNKQGGQLSKGFLPRSSVTLLADQPAIKKPKVSLNFKIVKADSTKYDSSIGQYGMDTYFSLSYGVDSVEIVGQDSSYYLPDTMYTDLYNVHFKEGIYSSSGPKFKNYEIGEVTYVIHDCGDGGGSYWIVWVIEKNTVRKRHVITLTP